MKVFGEFESFTLLQRAPYVQDVHHTFCPFYKIEKKIQPLTECQALNGFRCDTGDDRTDK